MPRNLATKPVPIEVDPLQPLETVVRLFEELNNQKILYCHWKSNIRLDQALRGETDFDLLLTEEERQVFEQTLHNHNVKHVRAAEGKDYPGIEHWIGFDPQTGSLFHLHVHYNLVLGEQHVKNYHLPLEERFLRDCQMHLGIRIPDPELELMILSMRALLKYRDRDAAADFLGSDRGGIPEHIRKEIYWLLTRISLEKWETTLEEMRAVLPVDAIRKFTKTFINNQGAWVSFLALRGQMRRELKQYQRVGRSQAVLLYFQTLYRLQKAARKNMPKKRMTLPEGGIRVAFIGPDGAGKSTLIKSISKWLGWRFTVRTYYMGTSLPSRTTGLLRHASKFSRTVYSGVRKLTGKFSLPSRITRKMVRGVVAVRYISEGRDRYRRYEQSCTEADQGSIVLYDRYPLEGIRLKNRMMDGPRIAANYHSARIQAPSLVSRFSQIEQEYYKNISPPDHLFILHVSPELALQRKPDHPAEELQAKSEAFETAVTGSVPTIDLQADLPLEEIVLQVRSAIWQML